MAITLVRKPDAFALTKGGRMTYQFSGSGRYATTGTPAVAVMLITGPVTDGTRLAMHWNGKTVEVVARDFPTAPNEFPTGDGSATYASTVAAFFQTYFPFREDFITTRGTDVDAVRLIRFTARRPGPAWLLTAPAIGTITFGREVSGSDPILRPQYSVYVELWLLGDDQTTYRRIYAAPVETDADGVATFDAGDVLHSELSADLPNWSFQQPAGAFTSHRPYYLCYGEAYGLPLQIGRITQDDTLNAYLGGADFAHRAGNGFELGSFVAVNASPASDRALRFGSKTRYVRYDEPQYLTLLNTRAQVTGLLLNVYLVFSDNTTLSIDNRYAPQTWPVGSKLTYPVGPAQLNLASYIPEGKNLTEYYVKVRTTDADYSTQYRYVINARYDRWVRYFAYLNSLGAIDTLTTYGKGSSELTRFYETAERYLPTAYDAQDGQFLQYDTAVQRSEEVTTGFYPPDYLDGWTDFYRSPRRFRLLDGKGLAIGLTSKSIKEAKDGDTQFAHRFEYQYLFRDDFYTADQADNLLGDGTPPPGFLPGGNVTLSVPTLVNSVDATVPDAARSLTTEKLNKFELVANRPNPQTLGYLRQSDTDALYQKTYTPQAAVTTTELPLQNLVSFNPGTARIETVTAEQVEQFAGKRTLSELINNAPDANIADRDLLLEANLIAGRGVQRGFYLIRDNGTDAARIDGFIGFRTDGTLIVQDVAHTVAISTEADGSARVNGQKILVEGQAGATSASRPLKGVVLITGSSLAAGTGTTPLDGQLNGFARRAVSRASTANQPLTYINVAQPGSYTDSWLSRDTTGTTYLETLLLQHRPEFVFIGFSLGNEINSDDHTIAFARLWKNLKELIALVRRYNAIPLVGSVYPRAAYTALDYNLIRQSLYVLDFLNAASINLLTLLDNGSGNWLPPYGQADGLHLTDSGNEELSWCFPSDYLQTRSAQVYPLTLDRLTSGVRITSPAARPLAIPVAGQLRHLTLAFDLRVTADAVTTGKALVYFGDTTGNPLRLRLRSEGGYVQLSYDGEGGVRQNIATATTALSATWQHVAVTLNRASQLAILYVNGKAVGQGSLPASLAIDFLTIGGNPADTGVAALNHDLRNLTLHTSPLYPDQITALAAGRVPMSSLLVCCPGAEEKLFAGQKLLNTAGYSTSVEAGIDGGMTGQPGTTTPTADVILIGDLFEYVALTPATETSRSITGPASQAEGTTASGWKLIKQLSDGSQSDVTALATWSLVNGQPGDSISRSGGTVSVTTASNQTTGDSRTLTLKATLDGLDTTFGLGVTDATQIVEVDRQIIGDSSITEGQTKSYSLRIQWSDGSYTYPSSGVVWSDLTPASGEQLTQGGQLSIAANSVTNDTHFKTIRATYGGLTKDKVLQVLDATTPPPTRTAITINGASSINEGTQAVYTVTATLSNGQTEAVPSSQIVWQTANDNGRTVIDGNGLLTAYANAVTGDSLTFQVKAFVDSLTGTRNVQLIDTTVPPPTRVSIVVNGPASVAEGSFADYTVTATLSDNTTETVPNSQITWALITGLAGDSLSAAGRLSVATNATQGDGHTVGVQATVTANASGPLTNTRSVNVTDSTVNAVVPSITGVWRRFDGSNINYWVRGQYLTSSDDYAVQYRHYIPVAGSDGVATYQWVGFTNVYQFRAPATAPTNLTSTGGGDVTANVGYGQYYRIEFRIVSVATGLPYDSTVYRFGEWTGESGTADTALRVYPDPYGLTATSPGRGAGRASDNPGYDVNNQNTSTDTTPDIGAVNS